MVPQEGSEEYRLLYINAEGERGGVLNKLGEYLNEEDRLKLIAMMNGPKRELVFDAASLLAA